LVNALLVWLIVERVFAPLLGISIFVGCLAGAIWLSAKANGKRFKVVP